LGRRWVGIYIYCMEIDYLLHLESPMGHLKLRKQDCHGEDDLMHSGSAPPITSPKRSVWKQSVPAATAALCTVRCTQLRAAWGTPNAMARTEYVSSVSFTCFALTHSSDVATHDSWKSSRAQVTARRMACDMVDMVGTAGEVGSC